MANLSGTTSHSRTSLTQLDLPSRPPPFENVSISLPQLLEKIGEVGLQDNELVKSALRQAQLSHANQRRDGGGPYLEDHVYPVTFSVIEHEQAMGHRVSAKLVATSLLHDCPEDDKSMPLETFKEVFGHSETHTLKPGRSVADLVDPLTKRDISLYPGNTDVERRAARDREYYSGLSSAAYETLITKLSDRNNNVYSLHARPRDKVMEQIVETESHYLEVAQAVSPIYYASITKRLEELKIWIAAA